MTDLYAHLIQKAAIKEGIPLPDFLIRRLAAMWKRSVEKAIIVGWYKDEFGPIEADAQTSSILRAAERALDDTL